MRNVIKTVESYEFSSIQSLIDRLNNIREMCSKDYDEVDLRIDLDYSECYYEGDCPTVKIISEWSIKNKKIRTK